MQKKYIHTDRQIHPTSKIQPHTLNIKKSNDVWHDSNDINI